MSNLYVLRHGLTEWNLAGRMQGRADVPLSAGARARFAEHRVPPAIAALASFSSPLRRAFDTARALGITPAIEERLIEMDWGEYEGQTLADLRDREGETLLAAEQRGLDFRPPGGESPRDVQQRLLPWLRERAGQGDTLAFTHKGVIRPLLALAYQWNMLGKAPAKLDWTCLHSFRLGADGMPKPAQCNIPLLPADGPRA